MSVVATNAGRRSRSGGRHWNTVVPAGRPGVSTSQRILVYLLRSSLVASQLALLVAAGVGLLMAGPLGAVNAVVGGAAVIVFFATGQGVQLIAAEQTGSNGLLLTLTSYLVRVVLLGLGLWLVGHTPALLEALRPGALAVGLVLTMLAWLGGMVLAHARVRKPVYDSGYGDQGVVAAQPQRGEQA